ncbi:hypothetical protein M3A49_16375 [Paraburkholderia sp. CNPSo 3076]|uniref:bestrophin-like domain n=1 Tax=Paraburkholderia sp. CNPSo 3076 TaxID=2940936 RepID=UPI00225B6842|nr:hypothetical protein [Paraburkholderia sp. CNPSo 3076]MCX5541056.1 hypothetical protein [Paraburkholderia sp. CNPSo 3076]
MHHLGIAVIVFACVLSSALLGLYLHTMLPAHHLSDESVSVIKLTIGLIATMAALVLGLLISSAKSSFDAANAAVVRDATEIILLDRTLAQYGPDTQEIRALLKQSVATGIQKISSGDSGQLASMRSPEELKRGENIQRRLAELSPNSETQRRLQARAIQIAGEVLAMRELALLQAAGSTPMPLLLTLVLWLCIIFGSFGLFTSPNTTVVITFFLGAISTSIAIFLILEMNTPLGGIVAVSLAPVHEALSILGQ